MLVAYQKLPAQTFPLSKIEKMNVIEVSKDSTSKAIDLGPKNVLKNPGFETKGKEWTIMNTGEWQSEVVHSGNYALKVSQKVVRFSGGTQTITFPPSIKKLEVSGWMKTQGVVFEPKYSPFWKASIAIAIEDSYGKAVGSVPAAVGQLTGNSDWTYFKNSYDIPEGGKQVRFCAFLSNCVGTTWFDDLEIKFITEENEQLVKVSNDNAAAAATLLVDSGSYRSNTTNCTLEEACINRKLTAKCLVYHNDQWFTFRTADAPVYYLIVKNQNCRDINGVQLLLIDGIVCEPESYNILNCVSFATQDDISLALNELKPNHQYIINLDGYLNDFCEFDISISTRPPDFHLRTDQQLLITPKINKDKVEFEWKLSEELQMKEIVEFKILRRFQSEKKFSSIGTVDAERSVHGNYKTDYNFTDSVKTSGAYYYKVLAISNKGERFLLSEHSFQMYSEYINLNIIPLNLDVKKKEIINIEIYDYPFNRYLGNYKAVYVKDFKLDLKPYLKNTDAKKVKLKISDLKIFRKEIIIDLK